MINAKSYASFVRIICLKFQYSLARNGLKHCQNMGLQTVWLSTWGKRLLKIYIRTFRIKYFDAKWFSCLATARHQRKVYTRKLVALKGWAGPVFLCGNSSTPKANEFTFATMVLIGECWGGNQTQTIGQEWFSNSFPYIFGFKVISCGGLPMSKVERKHVDTPWYLSTVYNKTLVLQQVLTSIIDGIPLKQNIHNKKKLRLSHLHPDFPSFCRASLFVRFRLSRCFPPPTTRMFSAMFVTNSTSVLYTWSCKIQQDFPTVFMGLKGLRALLGSPRKLGSMVSKWVISYNLYTYKWNILRV